MKAADAAGLVAARTGHVVEPALKARQRADVLQAHAALGRLLQRRDDIAFAEIRLAVAPSPCTRPNSGCRSEAVKSDRRRRQSRRWREIFPGSASCRDRVRARCLGSSSHALKSRLRSSSARIRSRSIWFSSGASSNVRRLRVVVETPSTDSRCGNRAPPISAHARSEDWSRCDRCSRAGSDPAGRLLAVSFSASSAPVSGESPAASQRRAISGAGDRHRRCGRRLIAFGLQHDIERHRQPRRCRAIAGSAAYRSASDDRSA